MTLVLPPAGLARLKTMLLPFASTDDARPYLMGIGVGAVTAYAGCPSRDVLFTTDGQRLRAVRLDVLTPGARREVSNVPFVLSRARIAASPKPAEGIEARFDVEHDWTPVPFEQVIPYGDGAAAIRVARKPFLAAVKGAMALANARNKARLAEWSAESKDIRAQDSAWSKAYQATVAEWRTKRKAESDFRKRETVKAKKAAEPKPRFPPLPGKPSKPKNPDPRRLTNHPDPTPVVQIVIHGAGADHALSLHAQTANGETFGPGALPQTVGYRSKDRAVPKETFVRYLHARYLAEALASFDDADLDIVVQADALGPIVIRPVDATRDTWNVAVIMPRKG